MFSYSHLSFAFVGILKEGGCRFSLVMDFYMSVFFLVAFGVLVHISEMLRFDKGI